MKCEVFDRVINKYIIINIDLGTSFLLYSSKQSSATVNSNIAFKLVAEKQLSMEKIIYVRLIPTF